MNGGTVSDRRARTILIPVTIGEDYQSGLVRRLDEYGIKRREIADAIGVHETQFSRWLRADSQYTGKAISIGIDNVVKIETAIVKILARRKREGEKAK